MTNEETQQVQTYIQDLQAKHAFELQTWKKEASAARQESIQMGLAIHEIRKAATQQGEIDPKQLAGYATQIIERFCPDCDIPF